MTHKTLPFPIIIIFMLARPALAQNEAVEGGEQAVPEQVSGQGETVPEGAPTQAGVIEEVPTPTSPVEGPLFVVASDLDDSQDVTEIYQEGEKRFLSFFWFWLVLLAGLAGLGGLAWWIWGKRQPRRMGKL